MAPNIAMHLCRRRMEAINFSVFLRPGDGRRSKDLRDEDAGLVKTDMPRRKAANRLMIGVMANSLQSSC
jgi:hypothetical protein